MLCRRAKPITRRNDGPRLVEALHSLRPLPRWALFTEVRSRLGSTALDSSSDILRIADAIAVDTSAKGWALEGFEAKTDRRDWLRELADPTKCGPLKLFCRSFSLVVPAPWKRVVLSLSELPDLWGMVEVDGSKVSIVVPAVERDAEEPTGAFMLSLLRSAAMAAQRPAENRSALMAPMQPINRPRLSSTHVGLVCGHVAARPLTKGLVNALPCWSCAEGFPVDVEVVEAAIEDAAHEDLERLARVLQRRLARGTAGAA